MGEISKWALPFTEGELLVGRPIDQQGMSPE